MPFDSNLLPSYGDTVAKTFTRAELDAATAYVQQGTIIYITDENVFAIADSSGTLDSITYTEYRSAAAGGGIYPLYGSTGSAAPTGFVALDADSNTLITSTQVIADQLVLYEPGELVEFQWKGTGFKSLWTNVASFIGLPELTTVTYEPTYAYFHGQSVQVRRCPKFTTLDLPGTGTTGQNITILTIASCPSITTVDIHKQTDFSATIFFNDDLTACTDDGVSFPNLTTIDVSGTGMDITALTNLEAAMPTVASGTINVAGTPGELDASWDSTVKPAMVAKGWTVEDVTPTA